MINDKQNVTDGKGYLLSWKTVVEYYMSFVSNNAQKFNDVVKEIDYRKEFFGKISQVSVEGSINSMAVGDLLTETLDDYIEKVSPATEIEGGVKPNKLSYVSAEVPLPKQYDLIMVPSEHIAGVVTSAFEGWGNYRTSYLMEGAVLPELELDQKRILVLYDDSEYVDQLRSIASKVERLIVIMIYQAGDKGIGTKQYYSSKSVFICKAEDGQEITFDVIKHQTLGTNSNIDILGLVVATHMEPHLK